MRLPGGLGRSQRAEVLRAKRIRTMLRPFSARCVVLVLASVALSAAALGSWYVGRSAGGALPPFEAIVVPGGGLTDAGDAPEWVRARLDRAIGLFEDNRDSYVILLSRGTPHKPPPLDPDNRPIDEAFVSAKYMRERGVPAQRLLQDTWSLDTIGNAVFARLMHLDPRRLRRVAVVTNGFHMDRTRAIFEWVLSLPPVTTRFSAHYFAVEDVGLTEEQLRARRAREASSLLKLAATVENIRTLAQLHGFVFEHHGSYATGVPRVPISKEAAASY